MKSVLSVLNKWGISVTDKDDYTEYLRTEYPDKFYYIDQCPLLVGEKHSQVDIFFQEVLDGTLSKKQFLGLEQKYRNTLNILWLYNNVFVESDITSIIIDKKTEKIDKQYRDLYPILLDKFSNCSFVNIQDRNELELLVQLGIRNVIYTAFYFEEYELLIIPSWSCLIIYFNDCNRIDIVEKIVNVEGLYLRPVNKDT